MTGSAEPGSTVPEDARALGTGTYIDEHDIDEHDVLSGPEVELIGALLWAPAGTVRKAGELLSADVFHRPMHGELFGVVTALADAGREHRAPGVLAELTAQGLAHGSLGQQRVRALTAATTSGASGAHVPHLAYLVASEAYRRSYHIAAAAIAQAATELPEAELFTHLVQVGTMQRQRARAMAALRAWAGQH